MSGTVGRGDTVDYVTGNTWDTAVWFDVTTGSIVPNTNSSDTVNIDGEGATIGGDGAAGDLVVAASPTGGPFVFTGNITASTFQLGGSGAEFPDPGLQISGGDLIATDTLTVDQAETLTVDNDGSITGPAETATPGVFDFGQIEVNGGTVTAGQFELQGSLDISNGGGTFTTLVVGSYTGEGGLGGTGQLSIESGASVDVTGPLVEDSQQGEGNIEIGGGTLTVGDEADIGFDGTADLTVTFSGSFSVTGLLDAGVENGAIAGILADDGSVSAGSLTVGDSGMGSLTISGGGQVSTTDDVVIGATSGATGTITISGDDSVLDDGGGLTVGAGGGGVLNINQGSIDVFDGAATVGQSSGATGAITLASASLDLSGSLAIGDGGSGSVEVDSDSDLQAQDIVPGGSANASGALTAAPWRKAAA